jgi:hypothetical protein
MVGPFSIQEDDARPGLWIWWGSLALFCVAAASGATFWFTVAYGGQDAFSLGNIRHAHSHLMYIGWATPTLMGLIWALLPAEATKPYKRPFRGVIGATFAATVLCYPLFLLYGYSPVQMGPVRMSIAAAASGLNILCWYAFVGLHASGTWGRPRTGPLRIWDVALSLLTLSTLGAWGVGVLHGLDVHNPIWTTAAIHFYLDLFSEGWFVLGLLGVMVRLSGEGQDRSWTRPLVLVTCGLPASFLLALPSSYLSGTVELAGRLGAGLVGLGLLLFVGRLYRPVRTANAVWTWGLPLLALGLKAAGQLAVALLLVLWPGDHNGLRILYLHLMLLGFVSMGLVAGVCVVWKGASVRGTAAFYGAVALVLGSRVLLIWPGGGVVQQIAAWVALLPLLAAGLLLAEGRAGQVDDRSRSSPLQQKRPTHGNT